MHQHTPLTHTLTHSYMHTPWGNLECPTDLNACFCTCRNSTDWKFVCLSVVLLTSRCRWRETPQTWASSRRPEPGSSSPSCPASPRTCRSPSPDCYSGWRTWQAARSRQSTQLEEKRGEVFRAQWAQGGVALELWKMIWSKYQEVMYEV